MHVAPTQKIQERIKHYAKKHGLCNAPKHHYVLNASKIFMMNTILLVNLVEFIFWGEMEPIRLIIKEKIGLVYSLLLQQYQDNVKLTAIMVTQQYPTECNLKKRFYFITLGYIFP